MRIFSVLFIVAFMLGCEASAIQVRPEEPAPVVLAPPPNVIKTECLEITAPPEWRLVKGETMRPTQAQVDAGEAYGVFSGLHISKGQDQDIVLIHPHGDAEIVEGMFFSNLMVMLQQYDAVQGNPAAALAEGVRSFELTEPEMVPGEPNGMFFTVTMVEVVEGAPEQTVHGTFVVLPLVSNDESTMVYFSTTLEPAASESIPSEALVIVRSLRFLCTE